jgi:hypothetical protein
MFDLSEWVAIGRGWCNELLPVLLDRIDRARYIQDSHHRHNHHFRPYPLDFGLKAKMPSTTKGRRIGVSQIIENGIRFCRSQPTISCELIWSASLLSYMLTLLPIVIAQH